MFVRLFKRSTKIMKSLIEDISGIDHMIQQIVHHKNSFMELAIFM
jgi:hypothetical protein